METSEDSPSTSDINAGGSSTPTNVHDFQKNVNKRINDMTDRQDSIQALSMWMIHHKGQCQKIASCWLSAMKRAKVERRLHLFYLANDIVQNCKKKNAKIFLLAFKNVLKDAVVLVRDASIANKIERIFHIWEERNTYFIDFIKELRELLNDREKVTAHVSATNFKPQDVAEAISKVKMLETHVGMKQKQVANLKIDASKIEAVKQLKDRSHSHDFAKQFDDSYNKMQGYVKILENEVKQRANLIELLENGQTFYEVQNDDAMVVANAYRNFGIRINNLRKRLNEYKETLPGDTDSPIPSPTAEAPSPGNTPPQTTDVADDMDMEVSDNEDNEGSAVIIAAEPYVPTSSTTSLSDRLAAMGNNLPGADPRSQQAATITDSYNPAEHLDRDKSNNSQAISYLSNLISIKASQSPSSQQDTSVLKNLKDFAEKVKNPPPVSWSDYKKKQQEKFEASMAVKQPENIPETSVDNKSDSSNTAAMMNNENQAHPNMLPTYELSSTVSSKDSSEHIDSNSLESFVNMSASSNELHSVSWPPTLESTQEEEQPYQHSRATAANLASSNASSNSLTSPQSSNTSLPNTPVTNIANPSSAGYKNLTAPPPPPTLTNIRAPAVTLQSQPATMQTSAVTLQTPPVRAPTPHNQVVVPRRNMSVEDQQDALQLLDNMHAASASNQIQQTAAESSHVYATQNLIEHEMSRQAIQIGPTNHGQPIMTLGDRRALPGGRGGFNRSPMRYPQPDHHHYNDHQPFPRKRPYQDYHGDGYHRYGPRYY